MTPSTLEIRIAHHVAVVWLARERVRNAFNETSIAEVTQAFEQLGGDDDVRAIVLAARGPAFCAGADLDWMRRMAGYSHDENRKDARLLAEMLRTIYLTPKPVIARVHGDAYAGGMGLVAACDVAVAASSVNFCLSETRLGLIPATISPYVIRAMGEQAARRYALTAERLDAAEALRIGFVHAVAAPEALDDPAHADAGLGRRRARGEAAGARGRRAADRRAPRRRYRRAHRGRPHQRRRPRGHPRLPREAQAALGHAVRSRNRGRGRR
jgi:methylglutaconyl-CoA hydratase